MRRASWQEHVLRPKFPLGTSRGSITERTVWYLKVWDDAKPRIVGIGEAAPLPGLSLESAADVRNALATLCAVTSNWEDSIRNGSIGIPSVVFAVEVALRDLEMGGTRVLFPSEFTLGRSTIPINGLVWMGDKKELMHRVRTQLESGVKCLKMKIGAIAWEDELALLRSIRKEHPASELMLRVDANGGFSLTPRTMAPARGTSPPVLEVLRSLAELQVHSIEQPIAAGRYELMAELCAVSPLPIALDEDLIGVRTMDAKAALLDAIKPPYIVLKPTLVGGWRGSQEWIDLATVRHIGWWVTSALESNVGLNAIAQWTNGLKNDMMHGLGTGSLFHNNIPSPLVAENGNLFYRPELGWTMDLLRK